MRGCADARMRGCADARQSLFMGSLELDIALTLVPFVPRGGQAAVMSSFTVNSGL
jgi:hypothetical protein